jgi:hypothetical protein
LTVFTTEIHARTQGPHRIPIVVIPLTIEGKLAVLAIEIHADSRSRCDFEHGDTINDGVGFACSYHGDARQFSFALRFRHVDTSGIRERNSTRSH